MALTLANTHPQFPLIPVGNGVVSKLTTVTFDSSYPTGGESFTPSNIGMSEFLFIAISEDAAAVPGYIVKYNYSTQKLMVFVEEAVAAGGPLLELADTTNIATLVIRVLAFGA